MKSDRRLDMGGTATVERESNTSLLEEMPELPILPGVQVRHCLGHPGYAVTDDGRVLSCKKRGSWTYQRHWKTLRGRLNLSGYREVRVNNKKDKKIHTLMLEAFVGPKPKGCMCCHSNGQKDDNRLHNLRWGTASDNAKDAVQHGTASGLRRGERHSAAKLTDQDVRDIRGLARFMDYKQIARLYDISRMRVYQLVERGHRADA